MHNFKTIGDFATTVRSAALLDPAANRAISSFGSTISGPDGGYAVPTDFVEQIFMVGQDSLAARCQIIPSVSSEIEIPVDESMPWNSTGIIAAWDNEGVAATNRKPELSMATNRLRKLRVLVPATAELVEDSQAFAAWLPLAMHRAVTWKLNDAILNGLGAALPLGILKSPAAIDVSAEGGQTAGTINDANITNMLARSLEPLASTWVANPAAYGQLSKLAGFDSATRTLSGLPIVLTDACAGLGSRGDIVLAGLGGYRVVSKGPKFAESLHMGFDQDLHAFRLVIQCNGQPILGAPTTPPNSATTRSHFVTLAART